MNSMKLITFMLSLFQFHSSSASPHNGPNKGTRGSPMVNGAKSEDVCRAAASMVLTYRAGSPAEPSLLNKLIYLNQAISSQSKPLVAQDPTTTTEISRLADKAGKDLKIFLGYFSLADSGRVAVKECVNSRAVPAPPGVPDAWAQVATYRIKLQVELELILNPPKNKKWFLSADPKMLAQLKDVLAALTSLNQAAALVKDEPFSCEEPI